MLAPPYIDIALPSRGEPAPPIITPVFWSGAMPPNVAHFHNIDITCSTRLLIAWCLNFRLSGENLSSWHISEALDRQARSAYRRNSDLRVSGRDYRI